MQLESIKSLSYIKNQNHNLMLAQYLKKKENIEVIEISSDEQPSRTIHTSNTVYSTRCKQEEDSFTILKNARPKDTARNIGTKDVQATPMIVEEVMFQQSENEYDYSYQINIFQAQQINSFFEEHGGDKNGVIGRPKQREGAIQSQKQRESVVSKGGVQNFAPTVNLRQAILRGWIADIVRNKSIPTKS